MKPHAKFPSFFCWKREVLEWSSLSSNINGSQGSIRKPFPPLDPLISKSIGKLERAAVIKKEQIIEFLQESPENAKHFISASKLPKLGDHSTSSHVAPENTPTTPQQQIPSDTQSPGYKERDLAPLESASLDLGQTPKVKVPIRPFGGKRRAPTYLKSLAIFHQNKDTVAN
ncbi:hypothetical protein AVEN_250211-1 [Araneus ventricosus]|uniref:Uncharacterized protein n=1 Tax=Araneus ventricosus TaxID=182803 RepID=A0A4Y2FGS8_ARAVE|nr:hypothetical protein AVEN_250211-1 [Araneus ventricosus]